MSTVCQFNHFTEWGGHLCVRCGVDVRIGTMVTEPPGAIVEWKAKADPTPEYPWQGRDLSVQALVNQAGGYDVQAMRGQAQAAQGMRLVDALDREEANLAKAAGNYQQFATRLAVDAVIEAQKARIAELEAKLADVPFDVAKSEKRIAVRDQIIKDLEAATRAAEERANRLGDEAGRLDNLTRELAIENSNLRRQLDAAKKGGKR